MLINLKEIHSFKSPYSGTKRYFIAEHTDKKVIFKLNEWESETPRTIEQVKEAYETAEFPSYYPDSIDYNYPLSLFSLTIFTFRTEIASSNMSLWEYEILIKGNKDVHPALKCAFIQHNDEEELSVMCESSDCDSMTTSENLRIVYSHWNCVKHEIMKLLNKKYEYIEALI